MADSIELSAAQDRVANVAYRWADGKGFKSWTALDAVYNDRSTYLESTVATLVMLGLGTITIMSGKEFIRQFPRHSYVVEYYGKDKKGNDRSLQIFRRNKGILTHVRSYTKDVCCPNCGHNFDVKSALVKKEKKS